MMRYNKNVYIFRVRPPLVLKDGTYITESQKSWKMLLTSFQYFFEFFSPLDALPAYFICV